jgi:hypothetical protein
MYALSFLKGMGIGATSIYFLDPVVGGRRRSLIRDQFNSMGHTIQDFIDRGIRDLTNRWHGVVAEAKASCSHDVATDERIEQRVRSTMGRYVSHPRAVDIRVDNGCVVLSGTILSREIGPFLSAVQCVRGVDEIANQLDVHESPDTPELQGQGRHCGQRMKAVPFVSSPGAQLLAAAAGTALVAGCLVRQRPSTMLLGCIGCGLLLNSLSRNRISRRRSQSISSSADWDSTRHGSGLSV